MGQFNRTAIHSRAEQGAGTFTPSIKPWSDPEDSAINGATWHALLWLPAAFNAFKLRVYNSAAGTVANFKCALAPTASITSRITPTGSWTVATFSAAGSVTLAAATANGGGAQAQPSYVDSDIMNVASIARADGGAGVYVMVRGYWPTGTGCVSNTGSNIPNFADSNLEFYIQGSVDGVGTPASFTSTTKSNLGPAIEVVAYCQEPVEQVLFVGDSLTEGLTATTVYGWQAMLIQALTTAGKKVAPVNFGRGSQTSTNYLANGLAALTRYRPRFATYFPYSPNDADRQTTAGNARMLRDMAIFAEACRVVGTMPIICTPLPTNGLNSGQEGFRRGVASAIRAFANASGVRVVDFDLLLTDYSVATGGYAVAGDTTEGVHATQAGNVKMTGPAVAAAMSALP